MHAIFVGMLNTEPPELRPVKNLYVLFYGEKIICLESNLYMFCFFDLLQENKILSLRLALFSFNDYSSGTVRLMLPSPEGKRP